MRNWRFFEDEGVMIDIMEGAIYIDMKAIHKEFALQFTYKRQKGKEDFSVQFSSSDR